MAKASTTNVVGNREDLSDLLTLLEPEMTPVTSMARKTKANGALFEWQVDALTAPTFGGVDEGEDVTSFDNKGANRARLSNNIQKFRRTFAVSDIQELVNTAGVPSEFARAQSLAAREIKRDVEAAICSSQDKQSQGGAGTPYKTRGFFRFMGWDGTNDNQYPSDIPTDQRNHTAPGTDAVAASNATSITEAEFNLVFQKIYEANGAPSGNFTVVPAPTLRRQLTDFARASDATYRQTQSADGKRITRSVTSYDGDFGVVDILAPSVFLDRTSGSDTISQYEGLILSPGMFSLHTLKAEARTELEDQGGGRRGFCDIICGLAVDAPKAHGYIYEG